MFHYVYSREGIINALDLRSYSDVEKKKKVAIKKGFIPSKVLDGIEYFDFDQLSQIGDPPLNKKELMFIVNKNKHKQLVFF